MNSKEMQLKGLVRMNGITPGQNALITKSSETKSEDCPICLRKFSSKTITTICNHKFDASCLNRWVYISDTCPLCRTTRPKRIANPERPSAVRPVSVYRRMLRHPPPRQSPRHNTPTYAHRGPHRDAYRDAYRQPHRRQLFFTRVRPVDRSMLRHPPLRQLPLHDTPDFAYRGTFRDPYRDAYQRPYLERLHLTRVPHSSELSGDLTELAAR